MKEFEPSARRSPQSRRATRLRVAASFLLLFSFLVNPARAQAQTQQTGDGQDQRGLGLSSDAQRKATPEEAKARGARPELVLQTGYPTYGATRMVFSPDARLLATTTFNSSQVKLWEVATGRELRTLSASAGAAAGMFSVAMTGVATVAFSRDGRLIAAGNRDGAVNVWEVASGRALPIIAGGPPSAAGGSQADISAAAVSKALGVDAVAFSPDGRSLIAFSGEARQYEVATGRELRKLDIGVLSDVGSIFGHPALTPDGGQMIVVATDIASKTTRSVKFIDLTTGAEARKLPLPDESRGGNMILSTSPDGRLLGASLESKAGDDSQQLKLWEITSKSKGRALYEVPRGKFAQVDFSPDGRLLALAIGDTVKVWDAATGQEVRSLVVPNRLAKINPDVAFVNAFTFSPDGHVLATSGFDAQLLLWSTDTGALVRGLRGGANFSAEAAFSPDGTRLYAGAKTVWDMATGRGLRATSVPTESLTGSLSPDGRLLAVRNFHDNEVKLFDAARHEQLQTLAPAEQAATNLVAFSRDARLLASTYSATPEQRNGANVTYSQSDAMKASKEAMKAVKNDPAAYYKTYIEGLTKRNVETGIQSQVKIWDTQTGRELRSISVPSSNPFSMTNAGRVVFSPDARSIAVTATAGDTVTLWDVSTGQQLRAFGGATAQANPYGMPSMPLAGLGGQNRVDSVAFSPDGRLLATGGGEVESSFDPTALMAAAMSRGHDPKQAAQAAAQMRAQMQNMMGNMVDSMKTSGPVRLWDTATGQQVRTLKGHVADVKALAFSADGRMLASASNDNTLKLWDVGTGAELRTLKGQEVEVNSFAFSPDGRLLASIGNDGAAFLWDLKTGEHLLTLISVGDGGDWLVVTPDGLFDGSPAAWNQILWRFSQNTFDVAPVETFFNEFFYPGLLSDITSGKRPKAPRDISVIDRRQPALALTAGAPVNAPVASRTISVSVKVSDAPAGAKDVRLFRNGSLIKVWHGDVLKDQTTATLEATIPVVAGENRLTAYAFNRDNVKSTDAELALTGADSLKRAGTAYILAVGVNQYENAQYNLKYAAADAQDFAEELRRQQAQLGRYERVEVVMLTDAEATKANILAALRLLAGSDAAPPAGAPKALAQLKPAQPEDSVIVYFAGHGTAHGSRFYLIPHDLGYKGARDDLDEAGLQTIISHGVSDEELQRAVEGLDAGQLLMVIDACNSGQALEAEEKRRGPMNSKGLAQLAYEKGMYILTAAQGYQAALEAAQLGHGFLTYVLVEEGLKKGEADAPSSHDGQIVVREWFDYAAERVPLMQLARVKQRGLAIAHALPREQDVQRPRTFYRRETDLRPLVVARTEAARSEQ
jgi:WD40 repeat protein